MAKRKRKMPGTSCKGNNRWFVYMLLCSGGRYYTGMTNNVLKRLEAHRSGKGARFTRAFGVERLLYLEKCKDRRSAMKREAGIKSKTKSEKKLMINSAKNQSRNKEFVAIV